jgi:hypothetical protein
MTSKAWLAAGLAFALAFVLGAARCGRDVGLGVDPASLDGAASDADGSAQ